MSMLEIAADAVVTWYVSKNHKNFLDTFLVKTFETQEFLQTLVRLIHHT